MYIIILDEFMGYPGRHVEDALQFLAVDHTIQLDTKKHYNKSFLPRNRALQKVLSNEHLINSKVSKLLSVLNQRFNMTPGYPPMGRELRERLISFFLSDINELEQILELDLNLWYTTY